MEIQREQGEGKSALLSTYILTSYKISIKKLIDDLIYLEAKAFMVESLKMK